VAQACFSTACLKRAPDNFVSAQNHTEEVSGSAADVYLCQKSPINEIRTVLFASGDLGAARRRRGLRVRSDGCKPRQLKRAAPRGHTRASYDSAGRGTCKSHGQLNVAFVFIWGGPRSSLTLPTTSTNAHGSWRLWIFVQLSSFRLSNLKSAAHSDLVSPF
jgi:hypothetical protein